MAKLGDVEFSAITEESPRRETSITDKPVEKGADVSDHARPQPIVISIMGQVTGPDAGQKFAQLQEYWRKSERLRYVGRNIARNMIIESFPSEHDAMIANGFRFNMTLKQIRITKPETIEIVAPDPAVVSPPAPAAANRATSTQSKGEEDGGRQQEQEKEADEEQRQSFLMRAWDSASGYFTRSNPEADVVTGAAPTIE